MSNDREAPRPCYREANGVHFVKNAHRPDCTDPDCRGCIQCHERHCTARKNCTWHLAHGELTCGRCIAGVRTDLRWIEALASLVMPAALSSGVESEAANLAGPAVNPETWTARRIAQRGHLAVWHARGKITARQYLNARQRMEDDDEHHPLRVLGTWEMMLREDYGTPNGHAITVASAAGYLDRTLYRVAHDEEQDFPQLRRELRKCRQHLEAVLHNDTRPDRGAPCPDCVAAQQEALHVLRAQGVPEDEWPKMSAPRLQRQYGHWCSDEACERLHYSTRFDADACEDVPDTSDDWWVCPRDDKHRWTHGAYERYVQKRRATA